MSRGPSLDPPVTIRGLSFGIHFPLSPRFNLRHKAPMTQDNTLQIKLRLKGGSGPNANWHWEIHDAAGKVVKTGSAVGPEHKAFATARIAKEKLEQSSSR
jgi:acyl-CoA thioesterase FadM